MPNYSSDDGRYTEHGIKLKLTLPLAQMLLAVVLLYESQVRMRNAVRTMDMPGPAPASTFLMELNLPVAFLHLFWRLYPSVFWDDVSWVAAIGLFWFWIAWNIDRWREGRTLIWFNWLPVRILADVLAITLAVFFGLIAAPLLERRSLWLVPTWASWSFWTVGTMFIGGYDLFRCVLRKVRMMNAASE